MRRVVVLLLAATTVAACGRGAAPAAQSTRDVDEGVVVVDPSGADVPPLHPSVDDWPEATIGLGIDQRVVAVAVKVAETPERRRHGLMEVEEVPPGAGMLFLFPEDTQSGFWMKDTEVPLGIAWADADGRIVDTAIMEPCRTEECPVYEPDEPYRVALEVAADWFRELGVDDRWHLGLPDGLPAAS